MPQAAWNPHTPEPIAHNADACPQPGIGTYFNPGVVSPIFQWCAKILDEAFAWFVYSAAEQLVRTETCPFAGISTSTFVGATSS